MWGTFLAPRTAPCLPLHASRGRGSEETSPSGVSSCVVGRGSPGQGPVLQLSV